MCCTFELELAQINEGESFGFACLSKLVAHRLGDDNLTAVCHGRDVCCDVDRWAEVVHPAGGGILGHQRLTKVQSHSHTKSLE